MARRPGPDPRLFDLWSAFYDWPVAQRLTYRPGHDAVLRALGSLRSGRVLDLGCGTGLLAARLQREVPALRVTGLDLSRGMLRQAAARDTAVDWVRGDAGGLPFADGAFDAAVCTEAFHWFPDPRRALDELRRVLAPGGRLLLALVNPPTELQSGLSAQVSRLAGQPLRWPTRAALHRLVTHAGLRVVSQRLVWRLPLILLFPTVLTEAVRDP